MVQLWLGLFPSILSTHWEGPPLLYPSYHLPPTVLRTFPQSLQALRDSLERRPACLPDIISGVGSGWLQ